MEQLAESRYFLAINITTTSHAFAAEKNVNLVVAYKTVNSAGKTMQAIAVNGQIRAPTLHFKEGDNVTINVYNHHARRKFVEIIMANKKAKKAEEAVNIIKQLYAIESEAKAQQLTIQAIQQLRQEKAKPILERSSYG